MLLFNYLTMTNYKPVEKSYISASEFLELLKEKARRRVDYKEVKYFLRFYPNKQAVRKMGEGVSTRYAIKKEQIPLLIKDFLK
jgi:hypothetical protein